MIPWVVKNSRIPRLMSWFMSVYAVALFPFIFVRDTGSNEVLMRHEMIHIKQQRETWIIGFYFLYLVDFVWALLKYRKFRDAYMSIRFEREAYANQKDKHYLEYRNNFAWRQLKV